MFASTPGSESAAVVELLPIDEIGNALKAVVSAWGLHLIRQGNGIVRIYGAPGTLDPYMLTEVWFGPGTLRVECAVPVLVPEDRLAEVLELCLALNTQGRVAFALGRRGTPIACHSVRLIVGTAGLADFLVPAALRLVWERGAAAEDIFRVVVAGADAATALDSIDMGEPRRATALPLTARPGPFDGPRGTQWVGVLEQAPPWPKGFVAPEGYSEREFRATTVLFPRLSQGLEPILDGCGGPLLFHGDGVVECYGCDAPASRTHLRGATVSCYEGLHFGRGHHCERCRQAS